MRKTIIDYILPEDWDRHNELLAMANDAKVAAKANKPKATSVQTAEQKAAKVQDKIAKLQAMLDALANGEQA